MIVEYNGYDGKLYNLTLNHQVFLVNKYIYN